MADETFAEPDIGAALAAAVAALEEWRDQVDTVLGNAAALLAARADGHEWEEILLAEPAPQVAALLSKQAEAIGRATSQVRRAQVIALYGRGLTMARIAVLLNVSRQRVAAILKGSANGAGDGLA